LNEQGSNSILFNITAHKLYNLGAFSLIVPETTTSEKKTGFLLIETFRKLFNPQIEGHLEHLQVAFLICQDFREFHISANLSTPKQYSRTYKKA
jgi:hypothetical protein